MKLLDTRRHRTAQTDGALTIAFSYRSQLIIDTGVDLPDPNFVVLTRAYAKERHSRLSTLTEFYQRRDKTDKTVILFHDIATDGVGIKSKSPGTAANYRLWWTRLARVVGL